jgi:hypothetical protein
MVGGTGKFEGLSGDIEIRPTPVLVSDSLVQGTGKKTGTYNITVHPLRRSSAHLRGPLLSGPLRHSRNEREAFLYAFDLFGLNGTNLRREPIEVRTGHAGQHPAKEPSWRPPKRARGASGGRCCVPARLQDGAERYRLEALGIALPFRTLAGLAQVQEPGSTGGEARGGGGLGAITASLILACDGYAPLQFHRALLILSMIRLSPQLLIEHASSALYGNLKLSQCPRI